MSVAGRSRGAKLTEVKHPIYVEISFTDHKDCNTRRYFDDYKLV